MRKIRPILAAALALLAAVSCKREPVGEEYGYLSVQAVADDSSEIVVKGAVAPGDDLVFSLKVTPVQPAGEAVTVDDCRTLVAEPLRLPVGLYQLEASSGTEEGAAWNSPFYTGSRSIVLKPEQTNAVSLTCTIASALVSVDPDDRLASLFSTYSLTVDNGTDALSFSTGNGHLADTAYFAVTGTLNWQLSAVNVDGKSYTSEVQTITDVKAATHYRIALSVEEKERPDGGIVLYVTMDDGVNEKQYLLTVDFSTGDDPTTTVNFEHTDPITVPKGSTQSRIVTFDAPKGIQSLVLMHCSATLLEAGLPQAVELVDAQPSLISTLAECGVVAESVPFGTLSASVDLTGLIGSLPLGEVSLTTNVTDTRYHFNQQDFTFNVISPVDAEILTASPWACFAIFRGQWFTDERPDGLTFQYRKESDSEWTSYDGDLSVTEGTSVFSAEIYGLDPGTRYVARAVSAKDTDTPTVSFTTEAAETLHNLSFDEWYQSGSAWYPNASSAYTVWDTANPGTASMGTNPTTPESSDVAVSGTGKKAAKLVSSTVLTMFAAGNIYVGQFVKVSGLGAELDWGYPFTSRPIALDGYYKYTPVAINKTQSPYTDLSGETDHSSIKLYLTDWTGPFRINTSTKTFFSDDDSSIIASLDFTSDETNSDYVHFTFPIEYRDLTRTPSYIVIVGAASRLGDYFTGGVGSTLLLDEFSLIYDPALLTEAQRGQVGYRNQ